MHNSLQSPGSTSHNANAFSLFPHQQCIVHAHSSKVCEGHSFEWKNWLVPINSQYFQSHNAPTQPELLLKLGTEMNRRHQDLSNDIFLFTNDWCLHSLFIAHRWLVYKGTSAKEWDVNWIYFYDINCSTELRAMLRSSLLANWQNKALRTRG